MLINNLIIILWIPVFYIYAYNIRLEKQNGGWNAGAQPDSLKKQLIFCLKVQFRMFKFAHFFSVFERSFAEFFAEPGVEIFYIFKTAFGGDFVI